MMHAVAIDKDILMCGPSANNSSDQQDQQVSSTRGSAAVAALPVYFSYSTQLTVTSGSSEEVRLATSLRFGDVRLFPLNKIEEWRVPEADHENIVSHFGLLVEEDKRRSLLVEYMADGSLSSNLRTRADFLTEDFLLLWMLDIARGLYFLHSNQITYGGLSLETIYLNGNRVKMEHPLLVKTDLQHSPVKDLWDFAAVVEQLLRQREHHRQCEMKEAEKKKNKLLADLATSVQKTYNNILRSNHHQGSSVCTTFSRIITMLEEQIPTEGRSFFLMTAKKKIMLSKRGANEDRVVPQKKFMLLDPRLPIVEGNVPTTHQGNTINTFTEKTLGKCRVAQVADKNGQGYYLEIEGGHFGQALVKYFENIMEIDRLMELYAGMGLSEEVVKGHRWTEECNNNEREITFAKELDHPNIMKILGFISPTGEAEKIIAIVMEGATFGLLEQYAKKEQLSDTTIKMYAVQLAEALQYCHEKMLIIHRDVRPRNIYVHDKGNIIKLGNFGYARVDDKGHLTSNKGDEVYYRAPEMFNDFPVVEYSFPVDVYSYGLVLWSISHRGEKPFYDNREQRMLLQSNKIFREYLQRSNNNRPKIRPNLNSDLAELIRSCWANLEMNTRPTMAKIVETLKKMPITMLKEQVPTKGRCFFQ